ncbi:Ig-like domain-containing protein [Mycobacterium sp. pW049]|uniref:Ig-like domain-containing protein n=1 Tax=[Mycobacterium] bulgaricum TaxID=3238985 RepID=UPI00351B70DF
MCALVSRHLDPQARHDADFERNFWSAADLVERNARSRSAKHAQRLTPNGAARIGRVGALAVSLGVGFAVAHSAGVAYADVDADASVSTGPESESRTKASATKPSLRASTNESGPSETAGGETTAEESETAEEPVEAEAPEDENSVDDADGDTSTPEISPSDADGGLEADSADIPEAPANTDTATAPDELDEVDLVEDDVAPQADDVLAEEVPQTDVVAVDVAAPVVGVESVASAAPEDDVASVDIMTAVVSSVLSPFTNPATPARAPWFDAVLAWVRRQITHTFFNESPEWGPIETQQTVTGQVLIDLKAFDPNGDPLTYKIVQPAHGVVFRDPLSGKFVYTPTTVVTGAPLRDTFTVTISDSSEHLKGLLGVIQGVFHYLRRAAGIAEPDDVTLMIPITANPIVELAPIVVVTPVAAAVVGQSVTVSPVLVINDLDSDELTSATVTLSGTDADFSFEWGELPDGVSATAGARSITFTGTASIGAYRDLLASVTLAAGSAGIRTVTFTVTDERGLVSAPVGTAVTVLGLPVDVPPLVVTLPVAAGIAGTSVTVTPIVVITDLDSDELISATVTVVGGGASDVLAWDDLPEGVSATPGAGTVTFTGAASLQEYRDLLASVTLKSSVAGVKTVTFAVADGDGNQSPPAATVVTMVGLPSTNLSPVLVVLPVAAGLAGSPVRVSPVVVITDLDSDRLRSAKVSLDGAGGQLSWGDLPEGVSATSGAGSVTFTGLASVADYRDLLASVTVTSPSGGINTVTFAVTDEEGNQSLGVGTVVTMVGLPGTDGLAPILVALPAAAGLTGNPVRVSPVVVLTDLDSDIESATVSITNPAAGDVLSWGTLPSGVSTTATSGAVSSVTFTGAAAAQVYQSVLQSLTVTSPAAGVKTVTFTVTDVDGNAAIPSATLVTVVGLPVGDGLAPVLVALPVAAGLTGSPVTVSPVVVLTDLDSEIGSATVSISNPAAGDVLSWGTLPSGVTTTATSGAGSTVTFTGAAAAQVYQSVLQSITVNSTTAGVKTVTFTVSDIDGNAAIPSATLVTVVGLPAGSGVAPVLVALPVAAGLTGNPVRVSPVVVLTDLDSDIESATVSIANPGAGDVLSWGTLPSGVSTTATSGAVSSVTFTGAAAAQVYQSVLQSLTVTSATAGVKTVTFTVTDADGNASIPSATLVTVVGLPVGDGLAPMLVALPAAAGLTGNPVTVSPVVVLTDLDSDIESATVSIANPAAGDVLSWGTLPSGVTTTATSGAVSSVTFTGAAAAQVYQSVLQSLTVTSATAGVKTVTFTVTDADGNASIPSATLVTVVGLPVGDGVAPVLVALPVAAGLTGNPVTVSPVVVLTDLDSEIESATVSISNPAAGDVLSWDTLPAGVTTTATSGAVSSVTFTGAAAAQVYQSVLQSLTLNSTTAGVKTVTFTVTDIDGNAAIPSATLVTVVGLPGGDGVAPVLVALPAAAGLTGNPVTVSPVVVLTDLDSDIESATVSIANPVAGDVLSWDTLPSGVSTTATSGAGSTVTFTGAASAQVYQSVLQSITVSSATAGVKTVTFTVTDIDGNAAIPSATLVTVVGLPVGDGLAPVLVALPAAAGLTGSPVTVSPVVVLTDLDSEIESATVTVVGANPGDVLSWDTLPSGVTTTATSGASSAVTFTGAAAAQVYQSVLQSLTVTSATAGVKTVTFTVTDIDGNAAIPSATLVTVVGLPVGDGLAPVLVALPAAAGLTGNPVTVSPVVVLTDLDSEIESATVSITNPTAGDVLSWDTLPAGVTTTATSGAVSSVTFTGAAAAQVYQSVLQAITVNSTTAGVKTVTFSVTDVDGNASAVSSTLVTVVGLPAGSGVAPVLVALPVAAGLTGNPVTVSPVVVLTDLDSDIESATVSITNPTAGDVLSWGTLPSGVTTTASSGAGSAVTFTGAASAQVYQSVLQSITATSAAAGVKTVTFTVSDIDGNAAIPSATLVTVVGLPAGSGVAPVLVALPVAAGLTGSPVTVSPVVVLTDLDSDVESATVSISNPAAGDVLSWGTLPSGVTTAATSGAGSTVTFTGAAAAQVYQSVLQSLTVTSPAAGVKTVTFSVTDVDGNAAIPSATLVTVVGLPAGSGVAPVLVALPVAAGLTGNPVTVSPVVVLTDLDSDIESATVSITNPTAGDVLSWGTLPSGVSTTATSGAVSSVTFTGAAAAQVYQSVLQSVTVTTAAADVKTVTFSVTDIDGNASAVSSTLVTVVGLPVGDGVAPVLVALPAAAGLTGNPVTVSPVVVLSDLGSDIESATVSITNPAAGDVLSWDTLPAGVTTAATSGAVSSVTFTGAAAAQVYQSVLQSITVSSATAGVKTVTFTVTDIDGNAAIPSATLVTVVGLPAGSGVAPILVALPAAAGLTGNPVRVSPVVVLTDLDSDIESATVSITNPAAGDVLSWDTLPAGVTTTATSGAGSTVTFTGAAATQVYQSVLQSLTLNSTTAGVKTVTFTVTDADGNASIPSATLVTVVGLPAGSGVAPILVALPAAAGLTGNPVRVSPVVVLTDLDSDIESATVSITNPAAGDVLSWDTLPAGVTTTATSGAGSSVTITGAASAQVYQSVLQSFTVTSAAAGVKTVTFTVTDADGNASIPSATLVTVVGLPVGDGVAPVLVALPAAAGLTGSPITVSPVVVLTDLDSDIESATVSITNPAAGDVLSWDTLPAGVTTTATSGAGSTVTFTGAAAAQVYQSVLQSLTLKSTTAGVKTVTFSVVDADGNASAASSTLVTVVGLSVGDGVAPVLVALPAAAGLTGSPITVSPVVVLTDLDSDIESATVSITNPAAGDVLSWDTLPAGVTTAAMSGAVSSVTFTGAAAAQVYQSVLQSITVSSTTAGVKTVTFSVTDIDGNSSIPSATLVTVVGLPVGDGIAPVLVALPAAAGLAGNPVTVSPVVVLTDLDSDVESATVSITNPAAGDVLSWDTLPAGVTTAATSGAVSSVTFTGAAAAQVYQSVLQSLTVTSAAAGVKTVTFSVTDIDGNASAVSSTLVTVVGLPVGDGLAPVLVALPAAAGLTGNPVRVSPVVVLTDLDSDIESATVSITNPAAGDVLSWDTLPAGVTTTATSGAVSSVTFTGAAAAQVYQSVLQSLTVTSAAAGVKTVTFSVTDIDGNASAVSSTLVTVVGMPVGDGLAPVLVALPAAAGLTGDPITVSPVVVLTDLDSEIESATVTVVGANPGDVLSWGTLPSGVSTTATSGAGSTVTFTGAASAQVYQSVLQSVTVTTAAAGVKTVTFSVTDIDGNASAVSSTLVTVVGMPVGDGLAPVLVALPAAAGLTGSPVTVSPVVVLTDLDSEIESATVSISNPAAGDVLSWDILPAGVTTAATSGAGSTVTFTGAAAAQVYQSVLQSLTVTSATAGVKTVTFTVTDIDGNASIPSATLVTVVGLPVGDGVAPVLVALPAAAGLVGDAVTVSPVVVLTDLDSDIESATVSISNPGAGDVLSWDILPAGVTTAATSGAGSTVTFTGAAAAQVYQSVLQSLTLNSTTAGVKTVTFSVTDIDGNSSIPSATLVTVVGLPVGDGLAPVLVALPAAAGLTGSPVTVSPVVVLTDLDSGVESATVSITNPAAGDVLSWGTLPSGVSTAATSGAGSTVTFTGAAAAQVYRSVLQSLTVTSATAGVKTVTFTVTDIDGNAAIPSATLVTVVGLPVGDGIAPVLVALPAAAGLTGNPVTVSPVVVLTDLDSEIESATVTVVGANPGDVLSWDTLPSGVSTTATSGAGSTVTFTGAASAQVYQSVLQSITVSSATAGVKTVTFTVTDIDGNAAIPSATLVTVVGLPVGDGLAPVLVALPAAAGLTGSPITVSPVVVLTDLDSDIESATVTVVGANPGDVLSWDTLPAGVTTTATSGAGSTVTFTGAAAAQVYQSVLQAITVNFTTAGVKTVAFSVTDIDGSASATSSTVTVVGMPVGDGLAPVLVALPAAAGVVGDAVTVSPVVVLTDLDSDIESATVTVVGANPGDVLSWDTLPSGVSTTATSGAGSTVTFTGAASAQVYQSVLQSLTVTSAAAGVKTVTFSVTDVDGNASAISSTLVTVVGLPVGDGLAPILVALPAAAGLTGNPITVSPVVVLTDLDSDIESATVSITNPAAGDVLSWDTLPSGVSTTATSGAGSTVTFTGAAAAQVYQSVLQSVTVTTAAAGVKTVTFSVTDIDGNSSIPSATLVTVVGLPVGDGVAPVLVALPAAAGLVGDAVTVSPVLVLSDLDSEIESATVTVVGANPGDVLSWGTLPSGVSTTATSGAGSTVTFTGAASAQVYQSVLQSLTVTSAAAGVKTVTFSVTDVDGNSSIPSATLVTVVGLPVGDGLASVLVALPAAAGLIGNPVTVSPVVVLTDLDSDIESATVSITNPAAGDVLSWDTLPSGVSTTATSGAGSTVTFTGAAAAQVYQSVLQSIMVTSAAAGVKTVTFSVTDIDGNASATSPTLVTVVGLPVGDGLAPILVALPAAAGLTGNPVRVSPVVVLTDLDSDVESATVSITNPTAGDVLSWGSLPAGVTTTATSGAGSSVTFTGAASAQVYQSVLQSLTVTSAAAGVKTVTFSVTDIDGNSSIPSATLVTVVGLPVGDGIAPVLVALPAAAGLTGNPVTVSPVVVLTDLDSDVESATVSITNPAAGDVLSWDTLPAGVTTAATSGAVSSVTFTGAAAAQVYQSLLQSLTLNSTTAGVKTVTFSVTDIDGNASAVSSTLVTVVGLPVGDGLAPVLVALPAAAGLTGNPVRVSPVVVLTDLDSDIESATVSITNPAAGDVLSWDTLPAGVTTAAMSGAGSTVTFTGAASAQVYKSVLQAITVSSTTAGVKTVTFTVTDGNASATSTTLVTVVGLPVGDGVAPVLVALPAAAGLVGDAVTVSPVVVLTDLDSEIESATVTVVGANPGDVLSWGTLPSGVTTTATSGAGSTVTFRGAAAAQVYQSVLQSLTVTSATAGVKTVTFTVTDIDGNSSIPSATLVTVVGLPVGDGLAPMLVALPAAAGLTGSPITVSPVVVLTDLDSDIESATVTVVGANPGDVLSWDTLPSRVSTTATSGAGSTVTFTGAASAQVYQSVLQAITVSSTTAGVKTVTFTVTDGNASATSTTLVTVVGLPVGDGLAPVLATLPAAVGLTGSPVTVSPVVALTDLDSQIQSATVTIVSAGAGDVLEWNSLPAGVATTATSGAVSTVTFTGTGTAQAYRDLLASVALTSSTAGVKSVTFTVNDAVGNPSAIASTLVTVVGPPTNSGLTPVLVALPAAAGVTGTPVTVSPVVVLTDIDSDIESATVTIANPAAGDVLSWDTLPAGVTTTATSGAGSTVTFTGAASAQVYQAVLQSITIQSTDAGIKTITFRVTDTAANLSAPSATQVTLVGLPSTQFDPIVVASLIGVTYTAGGTGIPVDSGVLVLDADSQTMKSATVTIDSPQAGDTLSVGPVPSGMTAVYSGGVLTITGSASVGVYQDLLRSVKFSTSSSAVASIKTITFEVTDQSDRVSAPSTVSVAVLSLPTSARPSVATSLVNVTYTAGGSAVFVDSGVRILDADSSDMSKAVITIVGGPVSGDMLSFTPQTGIDGSYNSVTGVLTFTGSASAAAYEQVLRSVTFATGSGALATIKSLSIVVTDDQGNASVPGLVAVTVLNVGTSIPPLVVTSGVNLSYTAGNSAVTVDSGVSLLDLDSSSLQGATVRISGGFASGDVLTFSAPSGIAGNYNAGTGVLTFTGNASIADYETALRSVQLSTGASALAAIKSVSFTVTDLGGSASLPGTVAVTVLAAPVNLAPLVTTVAGPIYTAGNTAVQVNSLLTILDLDTANMSGASVTISGNFAAGDVLDFTPVSGINGSYDSSTGVLTFTGTATALQYQQLLRSVTFRSGPSAPTLVKTLTFTVTDALNATSPGAIALLTQRANTAPVITAPLGLIVLSLPLISPTAAIVDDSSYLDRAVVTLTNVQSGDSLTFTPTGNITGGYAGGVLTLTGLGTTAQYQSVLQSIRFSKNALNLVGFRDITMVVRDEQGLSGSTSGTITFVL